MSEANSSSSALVARPGGDAAPPSVLGRRAGTPQLPGQPRLQRSRGVAPPNPSKPPKQKLYHLNKADIPDEASGFKAALELHLRILMGAMTNTSVPADPDQHTMYTFAQRYNLAEQVERLLRGNTDHYANADAAVLESIRRLCLQTAAAHGSQIASLVSQVPDDELRRIFATLHSFGLAEWRPDLVGGSPTSIYNGALESIALWTFEKAMGKLAYRHLKPNGRFLQDATLLQRLYNNFIWSYMRDIAVCEKKEPGSIVQDLARNKVYKQRGELGTRRLAQLRSDGFNPRIQALAEEPECHSDSERKEVGPGFWIMVKRARNPHVTDFYRWVDGRRADAPLFRGQRAGLRQEEPREPHPEHKETDISRRIPRKVPLDWFNPAYFNSLPLEIRILYRKAAISLPLASDLGPNPQPLSSDWKTMPEEDFMTKYGDKVRALYTLPTNDELRNFYGEDYVSSADEAEAEEMRN